MDRKSAHASPAATIKLLEQKAQRYDALLDHLAEGVAVIDLQGHITYANKAFLHISGYSAADLLAKDTSFLFDEENLRIRNSRIESRNQGNTDPYHITITRKDKGYRKLLARPSHVFDDEGMLLESMIIVEDLTTQDDLKNQLNFSRHLREAYLEACPLTFFIKSESGDYLSVNEEFSRITGTNRDEIRGRNTQEVWPMELAQRLSSEDELVIRDNKRIEVEDSFGDRQYIICKFPIPIDDKTTYVGGYFIDVTRQKATEKELRQAHDIALRNEEKYRILAEQAKDFIIHLSPEGNVLYINPFAAQVTGMSPEQLEGIHICKLVEAKDLPRMMNNLKTVAEKGVGIKSTVKNVILGREIYFETYLEPVFDKNGKVVSIHTLSRDITDRMKVQHDLARSEEKYRFLTENASENIANIAPDGTILFINSRMASYSGTTQEKAIGTNIAGYFPPDVGKSRLALLEKVCRMKEMYSTILTVPRPQGTAYLETNLTPVIDNEGKVISVMSISRDITEKENAIRQRQESEDRLKFALESSNTIAWTLNIPEVDIKFSRNVNSIIGLEADNETNIDHKYWDSLIYPEDLPGVYEHFASIAEGKAKEVVYEYRIRNLRGKTMWLLTRGKVTKEQENGLPLIISGTISDISYLKEVEFELARINANLEKRVKQELNKHKKQQELLVQKSKLESLGEMAAGIAHEINQPLGIILLSVENLNEAYHMGKAEKIFIENKLNTITKSIDKIRGITDHMRVFSRDQKLEFSETFSVNDVIRDTMSLMQTQYKNQQIDLRIELEENLPPVKGKKVHLEQVLQNLISNARYAVNKRAESDPSGQYRKTIRISTKTDNKMVCIHVRDNGTGISAKHMKQIFDPFFTTKQQDLGTGLGLSICYGLIREMKGKIQFESKPGEFTLAIACLPVAMAGKNSSKTA